MDMSKAKSILIISFTIINILLALALKDIKTQYKSSETVVNDEFVSDVVEILSKKDININTDIPKDIPNMNTIAIEYEKYDPETIAKLFLTDYSMTYQGEEVRFKNNSKKLIITNNNKTIVYEDLSKKNKPSAKEESKQVAINKAGSFIKDKGFNIYDYRLNSIEKEQGVYKLEYNKIYNGIEVEETYMKVEVNSLGIIRFERYWISNISENRNTFIISPASKALLRILTIEDCYGKTIESIKSCYYFNRDSYNNKGFKDTRGGNANPAWKILFSDGSKIYLEDT